MQHNPGGPAMSDADRQAELQRILEAQEKERRKKDQTNFTSFDLANLEYYNAQLKHNPDEWQLEFDASDKDDEEEKQAGNIGALIAGDKTTNDDVKYGTWKKGSVVLDYSKNGLCARWNTSANAAFDKNTWSGIIDFAVGKLGMNPLTVSFTKLDTTDPESVKQAKRDLVGILELAIKKNQELLQGGKGGIGISIELDDTAKQLLDPSTKGLSDGEKKRIQELVSELKTTKKLVTDMKKAMEVDPAVTKALGDLEAQNPPLKAGENYVDNVVFKGTDKADDAKVALALERAIKEIEKNVATNDIVVNKLDEHTDLELKLIEEQMDGDVRSDLIKNAIDADSNVAKQREHAVEQFDLQHNESLKRIKDLEDQLKLHEGLKVDNIEVKKTDLENQRKELERMDANQAVSKDDVRDYSERIESQAQAIELFEKLQNAKKQLGEQKQKMEEVSKISDKIEAIQLAKPASPVRPK
jgi:hypothetical protein